MAISFFSESGSAKKLRLVVMGSDFDSNAEVLVNGAPIQVESRSSTQIICRLTNQMIAAPADLSVQVRNPNNRVSNINHLIISP